MSDTPIELELLVKYKLIISGRELSEVLRALKKNKSMELHDRLVQLREKQIGNIYGQIKSQEGK